jgi:hypothetical protein
MAGCFSIKTEILFFEYGILLPISLFKPAWGGKLGCLLKSLHGAYCSR